MSFTFRLTHLEEKIIKFPRYSNHSSHTHSICLTATLVLQTEPMAKISSKTNAFRKEIEEHLVLAMNSTI